MCWQPIETAPMDGTIVELRRVHKGRIVARGLGLFGLLRADAPSLQPLEPNPLGRAVPEETPEDRDRRGKTPAWIRATCDYYFPLPTHWRPA